MKRIILDTNFLLVPVQEKVDIFAELKRIVDEKYELCVVEKTVDELKKLIDDKKTKTTDRMAAKVALQLLEKKKIKRIRIASFKTADDAILSIVDKDTIVATRDAILKRKLKQKGVSLIVLREKAKLELLRS